MVKSGEDQKKQGSCIKHFRLHGEQGAGFYRTGYGEPSSTCAMPFAGQAIVTNLCLDNGRIIEQWGVVHITSSTQSWTSTTDAK